MRKLSLIIVLAFVFMSVVLVSPTPSPHGDDFKVSCDVCHSAKGWKLDKEIYSFDHSKTAMPLTGQHQQLNCRLCHVSLIFKDAETNCIDCHTDMHYQTVGPDCQRCHTTQSWIVENTTEMHQRSRFPLVGPHFAADCGSCHKSASNLRFEPLGVECIDCHQEDYTATTKPNHVQGNYSTNCINCHSPNSFTWTASNTNHEFFPLTGGHALNDCNRCHTNGTFDGLSQECATCHQTTYNSTTNPNHAGAGFSTNCVQCHTTNPGWKPSTFDHSLFPLTLGHAVNECVKCHPTGVYAGTPTDCYACHETNFNTTTNPNHVAAQFPTTCAQCHTTNPGWKPATFDHSTFPLTLGHSQLECVKCHIGGNYTNTSKECVSCHLEDYNSTTNPNHAGSGFQQTCGDCHTTNPGWKPAQFTAHDAQFPIYSGKHNNQWTLCTECHPNTSNYGQFTCIDCHDHFQPEMDNAHQGVNGYAYNSPACYACHPTGSAEGGFNHSSTAFPLTGAHTTQPCTSCHISGFAGTTTICYDCHTPAYNQTTNPNHLAIGIANTCATCHTTNPGWKPATFPTHNNYYVLAGAHISQPCASCHTGNYNTAPTTCDGCHMTNYNQTNNPPHASAQFPTNCESCHTQSVWVPSTFDHDGQYFPIYSGKHNGEWNLCADCHTNPSNYNVFSCIDCHEHSNQSEVNNQHQGVSGYAYNSQACYQCHPNGNSGGKMMRQIIQKQQE
jgi:hypothetical protein